MLSKAAWMLCLLLAPFAASTVWPANKPNEEPPEVRYAAMLEREYGPLGKTTEQILGREATHEAPTIIGALVYRLRAKPLGKLGVVERKLLAVYALKEEVDNGGFSQYFSGPVGDQSALALQAFRDMQAAQLTRTMQKALSVFPAAKPPVDQAKRARLIEGMKRRAQGVWDVCDEEFYQREEGLAAVALAYAKKNRAQIVLP